MLETRQAPARGKPLAPGFEVEIAGLATAVPPYRVSQAEATARVKRIFPQLSRRESLYANTGIESRHVCEPVDWYHQPRGWEERTEAFQRHALELLERVTLDAVRDAGVELKEIDAVIVNTITGLAVPSLDAKLMNRLGLPHTVERLPIFGLGCGGGVAGLARAARYAQAMPGAHVLFLTVDLCSLCLRNSDSSMAMFVSTALFGDGAAGVILRNTHGGREPQGARGRVLAMGDHFWRGTEHIMGWDIKEDGLGVVLSAELPELLSSHLAGALQAFLDANGMSLGELSGFVLHPGGSKVLSTVQDVLGLARGDLIHSWEVLREFGNMSSPTALFALERAIKAKARGPHLLMAFGPGFSAYFLVLDL